ncbi:DUF3108 domain-containing protein [Ramlibacter sp. H39-3-26]|nr:DUF3108 domain-containing protein [Ramlibacter sp. H39-3-26]
MASIASAAEPGGTPPLERDAEAKVYPTLITRSFTVLYEMQRGGIRGSGEFVWKRTAETYEAHLKGTVAGLALFNWASQGGFDAAGVAPNNYVEKRLGKSAREATFVRGESKIDFSGSAPDIPLVPGTQDRVSWLVQLQAILAADPAKAKAGERVVMPVVGVRGRAEAWVFEISGAESIKTPAGTLNTQKLTRLLHKPEDTRAEVWVEPARQFLPVRIRLTLPPFDAPLDMALVDISG